MNVVPSPSSVSFRTNRMYLVTVVSRDDAAMRAGAAELARHGRVVLEGQVLRVSLPPPASVANSVTRSYSWLPYDSTIRHGSTPSMLDGALRSRARALRVDIRETEITSDVRAAGLGNVSQVAQNTAGAAARALATAARDGVEAVAEVASDAASTVRNVSMATTVALVAGLVGLGVLLIRVLPSDAASKSAFYSGLGRGLGGRGR